MRGESVNSPISKFAPRQRAARSTIERYSFFREFQQNCNGFLGHVGEPESKLWSKGVSPPASLRHPVSAIAPPLSPLCLLRSKGAKVQNLSELQMERERESAYRRGYAHGVHAAIFAVIDNLSEVERGRVESWVANILTPWSQSVDMSAEIPPPNFPRLDDNAS
jgi:hypothetical protein